MESVLVALGMAGAGCVLLAYILLTNGKLQAESARYQWLNVLGTAGVLLSLTVQWNLASFLLNAAWAVIGITGLIRIYRKKA